MPSTPIGDKRVVTLHYTLTNAAGEELDSSRGDEPLTYLHGAGEIVPGLEARLEGKNAGDSAKLIVPAEEGYGERQGPGAQRVARDAFAGIDEIEVGMAFDTEDEDGELQTVWVVGVEADEVLIDLNHPLAGEELHFDIEILDVRDATAEELHHGHAHGPSGHGHDEN